MLSNNKGLHFCKLSGSSVEGQLEEVGVAGFETRSLFDTVALVGTIIINKYRRACTDKVSSRDVPTSSPGRTTRLNPLLCHPPHHLLRSSKTQDITPLRHQSINASSQSFLPINRSRLRLPSKINRGWPHRHLPWPETPRLSHPPKNLTFLPNREVRPPKRVRPQTNEPPPHVAAMV